MPHPGGVAIIGRKGACEFLTEDKKCAKYEEILEAEKGSRYPMFGCGCSSSLFNEVRESKIREMTK